MASKSHVPKLDREGQVFLKGKITAWFLSSPELLKRKSKEVSTFISVKIEMILDPYSVKVFK